MLYIIYTNLLSRCYPINPSTSLNAQQLAEFAVDWVLHPLLTHIEGGGGGGGASLYGGMVTGVGQVQTYNLLLIKRPALEEIIIIWRKGASAL